jgi:hypothetical protein
MLAEDATRITAPAFFFADAEHLESEVVELAKQAVGRLEAT